MDGIELMIDEDLEPLEVEEEPKSRSRRRSWDRLRGRLGDKDGHPSREKENHNGTAQNDKKRPQSAKDNAKESINQKRPELRRDPIKSNKDIEQDKARAKRDSSSKALAEKEKAIKNLLDSDNPVPPGTEGEAIQIQDQMVKNQQKDLRAELNRKRNCSKDRNKSPPLVSTRRSPIVFRRSPRKTQTSTSPDRRRRKRSSGSVERRKNGSKEKETSEERRIASRQRLERRIERRYKNSRRSRSRDRRSPSPVRRRRFSRSPDRRHSPMRYSPRRRSRSRSPEVRARKRSPFINEINRQFRNDPLGLEPKGNEFVPPPMGSNPPPPGIMGFPGPENFIDPATGILGPGPIVGPPGMPPGMIPPVMHPGPPVMMPMPPHPGGPPMEQIPLQLNMNPMIPPMMHPHMPADHLRPPFMNFEAVAPPMNYIPPNSEYSSAPVLYDANSRQPPGPPEFIRSHKESPPKPVPAPPTISDKFGGLKKHSQRDNTPSKRYSPLREKRRSISPEIVEISPKFQRMKTPEPPIISSNKLPEKTSLSSLLEASVSSKDPPGLFGSYKGFKSEILRSCERALRSLPADDPRLKMRGRFFFSPRQDEPKAPGEDELASNSVLLRKSKCAVVWDEDEKLSSTSQIGTISPRKKMMHQKICQTEAVITDMKSTQTAVETVDVGVQVTLIVETYVPPVAPPPPKIPLLPLPEPIDPEIRADLRPDLEMRSRYDLSDMRRDTYDHQHISKVRDTNDLRWSLNAQKKNVPIAPPPPSNSNSWISNKQPLLHNDHFDHNISVSLDHSSSRNVVINSVIPSNVMMGNDDLNNEDMEDEEYEQIHNRFADTDAFERHSQPNNLERPDFERRRPAKVDDSEDLEIIEERVYNPREVGIHSWNQRGNNLINTKQFNKLPQRTISTNAPTRGKPMTAGRPFRGVFRNFK